MRVRRAHPIQWMAALLCVLAACAGLGTGPIAGTAVSSPTPSTIDIAVSSTSQPISPDSGVAPPRSRIPAEPIRAAFFYPWFPKAWSQRGSTAFTNYEPTLGLYDSTDPAVIDQQLQWGNDAGIDAFISSWWGPDHHTDDALLPLLDRTVEASSPHPELQWPIYYERESQEDPTAQQIAGDLDSLADAVFNHPAYLRVDGRPVVFVFADDNDGVAMTERWAEASSLATMKPYTVLKVFSGYRDAPDQPDSWHQYGPAAAYDEQLPHSATVSPGFWLAGDLARLERDLDRFRSDVARMTASGATWQLITSWNEWGEGTAVEPAIEYGRDYIDVLATAGADTADPSIPASSSTTAPSSTTVPTTTPAEVPTTTVTVPDNRAGRVTFTAAGDFGANDDTTATLQSVAGDPGQFMLALGDLSYSELSEQGWCDYVKGFVGESFPVELVVGNHEDDDLLDGFIGKFTECLPDRMESKGTYGSEYYFDVGELLRVVMIGAANDVDGIDYDYAAGTAHHDWLTTAVRTARAEGIRWVVVGMHKPCITAGNKDCEISTDLVDLLINEHVDLVLHGHDHNYQRSHQLSCAIPDIFEARCLADDGSDGRHDQGDGTVFVIVGSAGGGGVTKIRKDDAELGYFASWMGIGESKAGRGHVRVSADVAKLQLDFVGSTTAYTDSVIIQAP